MSFYTISRCFCISRWKQGEIYSTDIAGYGGSLTFATKFADDDSNGDLTNRMVINQNGNVGIGTTNPSGILHLNTTTNSDVLHMLRITGNPSLANGQIYATGAPIGMMIETNNDDHDKYSLYARGGTDLGLVVYNDGNVKIDGNVGIGTSASSEKLLVDGDAKINGDLITTNGYLSVSADSDNVSYLGRAAIGYIGYSDYAGFAHKDRTSKENYALMQHHVGHTYLNTSSGKIMHFRENNVNKMVLKGGI